MHKVQEPVPTRAAKKWGSAASSHFCVGMAFSLFRRKKKEGAGQEKSHFYHRFAQQELAGWSPVITAKVVVIYFFAVACVCVALGVPVLVASLGVVQYTVRYDDQGNDMAGISDQARTSVD